MSNKAERKYPINLYMLPLAFVLGILPFIVRLVAYDPKLSFTGWFGQQNIAGDAFLYYKQIFFIAICVVMICLIILQHFIKGKKLSFKKIFIPLAAYAFLSLLSSICSEYAYFSFHGIFSQFESVWVLLGYTVLVYYSYLFVSEAKDVQALMTLFTISTFVMLLLGLSQAFGHDFFRTNFAAKLIVPAKYRLGDDALEFKFAENTVYLTLYNPNYVGSYVSLISPIFLMQIFTRKKIWSIVLNALMYVGLLLTLLGSGSRAGLSGVFASLIILIIIYGKRIFKYWMELIIVAVLIIGTIYTMNNYSNNAIYNRVKSALVFDEKTFDLEYIETNDDDITLKYKGNVLKIDYYADAATENVSVSFYDSDDYSLGYYPEEDGYFRVDDERFDKIKVAVDYVYGEFGLIVNINGKNWTFAKIQNTMFYLSDKGAFIKINNAPTFGPLEKYPQIASGRGFIWGKTIPLLKDYIFLGSGADTFSIVYPNDDYVGMYNAGYENQVMTKPHNMFLQIATQTGVVSLICFLAFYFWYFVSTLILLFKSDRSKYTAQIAMGILSGSFGYMVVGVINDSTITVAPLFWALVGVGIGINEMIKRDNAGLSSPIITSPENDTLDSAKSEVKKVETKKSKNTKSKKR